MVKFSVKFLRTYGNGDVVVGEDQGGVDAGKFAGGHFVWFEIKMVVQDVDLNPTLALRDQAR